VLRVNKNPAKPQMVELDQDMLELLYSFTEINIDKSNPRNLAQLKMGTKKWTRHEFNHEIHD
jgi:hypothetical protein